MSNMRRSRETRMSAGAVAVLSFSVVYTILTYLSIKNVCLIIFQNFIQIYAFVFSRPALFAIAISKRMLFILTPRLTAHETELRL